MGRGPPPRDWDGWDRDAREPGGWERGERERERGGSREREDGRPDLLRMSYDEYVAKFRQLKELQVGIGVLGSDWFWTGSGLASEGFLSMLEVYMEVGRRCGCCG